MPPWLDLHLLAALVGATGVALVVVRLLRPRSLAVGDKAPDVTLADQDGRWVTLSHLQGRWVVLAFYPRANTYG